MAATISSEKATSQPPGRGISVTTTTTVTPSPASTQPSTALGNTGTSYNTDTTAPYTITRDYNNDYYDKHLNKASAPNTKDAAQEKAGKSKSSTKSRLKAFFASLGQPPTIGRDDDETARRETMTAGQLAFSPDGLSARNHQLTRIDDGRRGL